MEYLIIYGVVLIIGLAHYWRWFTYARKIHAQSRKTLYKHTKQQLKGLLLSPEDTSYIVEDLTPLRDNEKRAKKDVKGYGYILLGWFFWPVFVPLTLIFILINTNRK
tara:strand:- start:14650 stop:14970 length:321 start_codon:yes stop_codon:yes gene_type:complete